MEIQSFLKPIIRRNDKKIIFLIADGLGGLPGEGRKTELEAADTPNLDRIAGLGTTGLFHPVAPGITPGSGPGHLGLFGYDPVEHDIGRGVLSALGLDFNLRKGDVAARGNFCTVDENGLVTDRRAGRIPTEKGAELCAKLLRISLEGVELFVEPEKEHRFLLVIRGPGLGHEVEDTDPQITGVKPLPARPREDGSARTARIVQVFTERAGEILRDESPANMVLLRGFDTLPEIPSMEERYGLHACGIAAYPMYRGISRLLGMAVKNVGAEPAELVEALRSEWENYDFFFCHFKKTDSSGEDGDFDAKVRALEAFDRIVPGILELGPDVFVVTGDHSTPCFLKSHSWHPVPVLLFSPTCRPDDVQTFGERACTHGGFGQMPMTNLIILALAHAGRLAKYGA